MISKSGRISPNPSANPVTRSKRLISISLCLVALVAGVFLLRGVIAARQNHAKQMVAPVTGNSSEAKIPVAKSAGNGAASGPMGQAQNVAASSPKAVAPQTLKNPESTRTTEMRQRQRSLRLQEAKEAAIKLMLKDSRHLSLLQNASALSSLSSTPRPQIAKAMIQAPQAISLQPSGQSPAPPSAASTAGEKNRLASKQKPEGT